MKSPAPPEGRHTSPELISRWAKSGPLRVFMDTVPALMSYVDLDFRYRAVNNKYEHWFGLNRGDIEGHHIREIVGEAQWEKIRPSFERAFAGETVRNEGQVPDRTGESRWVSVTLTPDFDEERRVQGVIALVTDITARKKTEHELARSKRQVTEILESIQDGFYALDRQWNFTYANRHTVDLFGFNPEDMIGKSLWEILPETLGSQHEVEYRKAMDGEFRYFEMRGVRFPDKWFSASAYPSNEGISVYWQDITERKRMAHLLREKESEFQLIANATPVILNRLSRDLKFVYVNSAFTGMFSLLPEEIIGKPIVDVLGNEAFEAIRPHIEKVLRGERVVYEAEIP